MYYNFWEFHKINRDSCHLEIMQEVINTAQNVAEMSSYVCINKEALVSFLKRLLEDRTEVPPWNPLYHFCDSNEDTVSYLLVLDSLNFCFWPATEGSRWEIKFGSRMLSGYYALAASLKRAVETGIPIIRAEYLAELSLGRLKRILTGRGELQLLENRVHILNELGQLLLKEYDGKAHRLVEAAGMSAVTLARLLAQELSSFRDVAGYMGHNVFFYKRAQIFAADLHGAFDGKGWGSFTDMGKLTAFADYKLPQVLRELGILRYTEGLARTVDQGTPLGAGSPAEVEIRANTIWAVELIRQELEAMGRGLRAFEIDWILWNMGQAKEFKVRPYHRTVTIFY
jgi:hypothetical protein